MVAGASLILAISFGGYAGGSTLTTAPQTAAKPAAAATTSSETAAPSFVADPSAPALALGPDGTPEPYWRLKQREARARLLRSAGATGSVGIQSIAGGSATRTFLPGSTPTAAAADTGAGAVTREVATGGRTPLAGVWSGTPEQLETSLLASNPRPSFTVPPLTLAGYYVRYAAEVGLRADVLWAQMLHETGYGTYGGSVRSSQNNYAGIGATGGGEPGVSFPSAEDGVKAHIAHLVAYVFTADPASWTNLSVDPRYDAVNPRGIAKVLSDLDGRWAVPGVGYGAAIERIVAAINQ